jgi:hypothetical protein
MWRSILAIASLGALAVPSGTAAAAAPSPSQDYAIGSGTTFFLGSTSFDFEVVSGPSGENPIGSGTAIVNGRALTATEATCLSVTGNTATTASRLAPNSSNWQFVLVTVVDNSPTGVDTFAATVGIGSPFTSDPGCSRPVPLVGAPLVTGDIVVHDAPPLPTVKAQCAGGGWRAYGIFNNQGDCVSFVATKGKNPPANP